MAVKIVQTNTLYLSGSGTLVGATTVSLTSLTDIYGNVLTMTDFGSIGYITLEPDTTNEEAAQFTGVTANANGTYTLTGVSTVLAKSPYTATSGLVRQHSGGTKVVVTDTAGFWATFANKNNDEIITGNWTFNIQPTALSATPASTTALGNVRASVSPNRTLGVATITIASPAVVTLNNHGLTANDTIQFTTTGALPTGLIASTTYFVISTGLTTNTFQLSATAAGTAINTTGVQSGVHTLIKTTPVGIIDTDYRLPENAYALDTGSANAYVITLATAPSVLKAGQQFLFKAANTNTTASTIAINGLGAVSIIRQDGSALAASDIQANGVYEVTYDGTSFRVPAAGSSIDYQTFTANGTWTKPSGLSGNEQVKVQVWGAGGAGGGVGAIGIRWGGGGGGGAYQEATFPASFLASTVAVTVAAGGTGSSGAGTAGGNSSFGTLITAYGGGGGGNDNGGGGGGGGLFSAGLLGVSGPTGAVGGAPLGGAIGTDSTMGGGGGGSTTAGGRSVFGGGGGAGENGSAVVLGGSSIYGGGGGGGGSTAGSAGGTSVYGGNGGSTSLNAAGAAGTAPAGGGGGASSNNAVSYNGGNGARGEVRVWVVKS